jgi:hypothetical protein
MKKNTVKSKLLLWGILGAAVICMGAVGLVYSEEDEGEESDSSLAQYYGFGPMEILKLQTGLTRPIVVDINQDGLNDIVVINNRKARIEQLLQKKDFSPEAEAPVEVSEDDINDIFGKERTWRFKRVSFPLDVAAASLVVCDLNGDGNLDLAYYAKDGLRVVLQNVSKGTEEAKGAGPRLPVWETAKKFDIREGLAVQEALTNGDLNGDGKEDLGLLTNDGVFILLQNAEGELTAPVKYHSASNKLKQINIADVNGDKRSDLVLLTAEHEEFPVRVRFQKDQGQLGPELRYHMPVPVAFEPARLEPEGASNFVTVSRQSGRVEVSTFPSRPQEEKFPVATYPLPVTEKAENRDVVAADVDGDGLLDIVVSDPARAEFLLFRAHKEHSLTSAREFPGLKSMQKLCAGKLDDSDRDTIVALSFEEKMIALSRLESGRLSYPETVAIEGEPQTMELADIDGDGELDLVYVAKEKSDKNSGAQGTKYWLRTVMSLGREKAQKGPELELQEIKDKPQDMRAADIDHDGRVDVMIIRSYEPILLLRQKSAGKFESELSQNINDGLVAKVNPEALSFAHLGPGGKIAALLVQKNFARAIIFNAEKGWQVLDQYQASHPQSNLSCATASRLNISDTMNIITYDSARSKLEVLARQEDGTYRASHQVDVGAVSAKKILAGNFGGATSVSLIICGTHKLMRVPVAEQTYSLNQVASFEPDIKGGRFGALTVGDVNSDDCPDIVCCEQGRNHLQILTFNAEAELVSATKFKVFEQPRGVDESMYAEGRQQGGGEPRAVTIGDVTGDGKNDLVLLVHDRIIIYPQD